MTERIDSGNRLTPVQWLICAIAAIGFAFDIYEILMLPLIVRPALLELTGAAPGSPQFQMWVGRLFYIPAFAGGIFGLIGGYLTDRLGRRRVLTYSILIYAIAAFLSGYSTSIGMLLLLRCFVFIGVCVEFVAAVAWLAELFPEAKRREKVLGYTQAFSSLGGIMVATINGLCVAYAAHLPALNMFGVSLSDPHAPWRYTLMSGVLPAIPLILIRPFLPESPAWEQKKAAGTLRRPSIAALFAPDLRRTTIVTTIMFACAYGAAFGAIQQVQQIVPGVPEVRQMVQGMPPPRAALTTQEVAANVIIVSRRQLVRLFQLPGVFVMLFTFAIAPTRHLSWLYVGMFLAGFFTVAQFSFWGNYLPRVYPLYLRGTGESFAANIGGRLIGTSFAWLTATLAVTSDRAFAPIKVAYMAAAVGFSVYVIGFIASFWLPEPPKENLPD
jgi:MFS family permease